MAIFLIAIGLIFTILDFTIGTGIFYPAFVAPKGEYMGVSIGKVASTYSIDNILGDQIRLDIFADTIGCVLIIIASVMLYKHNKKYSRIVIYAILTIVVSLMLRLFPLFANGGTRIVFAQILFFLLYVVKIFMEYKLVYTTVGISDDMANVSTNKRVQFIWWVTVFTRAFIAALTYVGLNGIKHAYQGVTVVITLIFAYQLVQTRKYIGKYKVYKEGFNSAFVPDFIWKKMPQIDFDARTGISKDDLRYTRFLYYNSDKKLCDGEMISSQKIAYSLMQIFYKLYKLEVSIDSVGFCEFAKAGTFTGTSIMINSKDMEFVKKTFEKSGFETIETNLDTNIIRFEYAKK